MTERTPWGYPDSNGDSFMDHNPPLKEYQQREIFAYGRYLVCQILNWADGPPPKFLVCHPLDRDYREEFLATQGMGTWMRVDLREALRLLSDAGPVG